MNDHGTRRVDLSVQNSQCLGHYTRTSCFTYSSRQNKIVSSSPAGDLQEFLVEIRGSRRVDLCALAEVLVRQAQAPEEATRLTGLRWLREVVALARQALLPQYAAILAAVLPAISYPPGHPSSGSIAEVSPPPPAFFLTCSCFE